MKLWRVIKKHPRYVVIPALCVFLAFYFTYHAITGNRGLLRYLELRQEIQKEATVAQTTQQQRAELQAQVNALSPDNLDLDMLDEIGRQTLNVGEKDDFLIFHKKSQD